MTEAEIAAWREYVEAIKPQVMAEMDAYLDWCRRVDAGLKAILPPGPPPTSERLWFNVGPAKRRVYKI